MSSIRLVHTADNHIGLRFNSRSYGEDLRQALIEERFAALQRVVSHANQRDAHFLVVAGDLFDHLHVARNQIERTAALLNQFAGIHVVVLPGNHDFYEPGHDNVWDRFAGVMNENLLLLLSRPEPVRVPVDDREVVFYPGPCTSKTSATNAIGWVRNAAHDPHALNIGVAHGSVSGISPDNDDKYFQMSPDELRSAGVDFWLLGHTHLRYPAAPLSTGSAFYLPSTHTPDGFDCNHEGYVWLLQIDDAKSVTMESIRTGEYRFLTLERDLRTMEALAALESELQKLDPARTLLKLLLHGRLSAEGKGRVETLKGQVASRLCYSEVTDDIALNIDRDYVDRHFSQGSLPHLLLTSLQSDGTGDLALQLAYDLIREAGR